MMHDLESILDECYRMLDSLDIQYVRNHTIVIDSRLKRCWGSCRKNKDGSFLIKISPVLMDEHTPSDSLKDTLYHELLHTVPNAMSHGKTWLHLAQKVNGATGLNIKRSTPASEKGILRNPADDPSVKFMGICEGCGAEVIRYRNCAFVRYPEKYRCGRCGGKFKVVFRRL